MSGEISKDSAKQGPRFGVAAFNAVALDDLDHGLLASMIRNPAASFGQWAAENNVSPRTVARRYEQLRRRGVVHIVGRTLPGFGGALAWMARIKGSPGRLGPIAAELATLDTTRWVRYSRDRSELICGVVTGSKVYDDLLYRLHSTVPARDIATHQLLRVWGGPGSTEASNEHIDDLDRRMLALLAKDGRATATAIADELALDTATVSRRRRRLIDAGILYFEADVHPAALTQTGDVNLWIRVQPGQINALGSYLRSKAEVRFVAAIGGTYQIVANVVVPTSGDVINFVDNLDGFGITDLDIVPMGNVLKRFMQ